MTRNDMDIDEILKHYLPRASQEEVDEASEIVLNRIRSMRFQPTGEAVKREARARAERKRDSAQPQKKTEAVRDAEQTKVVDAGWMLRFHVAVLMAVEQLQGNGRPVTITLKVEELLEERIVSGSAVFLILLMMERFGLVSSSPINPEQPKALDKRYFEITAAGREALAKALAAGECATDPLEGFV
jgi:DNA-binding PadR family transcriptional regulator